MEQYVANLGRWIASKQVFADRLFTTAAKKKSAGRQARSYQLYQDCIQHNSTALSAKYGISGLVQYLIDNTDSPDMVSQMDYLRDYWIPQRRSWLAAEPDPRQEQAGYYLSQVVNFHRILTEETQGLR